MNKSAKNLNPYNLGFGTFVDFRYFQKLLLEILSQNKFF